MAVPMSPVESASEAGGDAAYSFISTESQEDFYNVTTATADVWKTQIEDLIWMYCSPPIFIVGIIGNVLTVLVTSRRPTRCTSSGVYLTGMSVAAIGVYLFGLLCQWLRACGFINLTEQGPWSCRFNKFIYYSSGDIAIWNLTLLNVDRLVAVCLPLRKADICTHRRAVTFSAVVIVLTVAKNLHLFWTLGTVYHPSDKEKVVSHCDSPHPYTDFQNFVRPWIVFAIVTMLPIVVIITCNTLILRQLARSMKLRRSVTGRAPRKSLTRMTTMMCLGASLSFIFFSAPSIILVILKPYYPGVPYDIAKAVNNLLVHVNYAANFFLYCLGGQSFRMRLRMLLVRMCCRSSTGHFRFSNSTLLGQRIRSVDMEVVGNCIIKTTRSDSSTPADSVSV